MRAVRFHEWGSAPQVDLVAAPVAAPGETLVRVEAAAVAHLDLTVASGDFGIKPALPYVAGVEGSGVVVRSDELAAGTRVLLRGGGLGLLRDGTWAEYVTAGPKAMRTVPDGMAPELAATWYVPATTAHVALHTVAHLAEDEVVVVAGAAGAVGSLATQLALQAGASVVGLVAAESQRELVPAGAEAVVASDEDRLAELAATRSATLLVDTIGGEAMPERCRWVRAGGRAALIGYVAGTSAVLDLPNWLLDDVALLPVNMIRRDAEARACAPELAERLTRGELRLEVEQFGFEQVGEAIAALAGGRLRGRAVLVPA